MTVVMTVSNTGGTDAINVNALPLTRIGTGYATLLTGPQPNSITIQAGGAGSFTWTYSADSSGSIAFFGRAEGMDIRTGQNYQSVTATSNSVIIETRPQLSSSISILRSTMNLGQTATVIMTVTNSGIADAVNTAPNNLFITSASTGGMIPVAGPSPANQTIVGGTTAYFTWTFSATGQGNVVLSGNVTGYDENSGLSVSSSMTESNSVLVQIPAQLIISLKAVPETPPVIKTGQLITVYLTVSNSGQSQAISISPVANPAVNGTGAANLISGPSPSSIVSINGSSYSVFTWIYQSTTQGNINFTASVFGFDANTGETLNSNSATSNTIQISDSAYLLNDISVSQSVVSTGQQITVILTVTNGGTASTTTNVTPYAGITYYGASLLLQSSPTPAPALGSGLTQTFTWVYTAQSAGSLVFTAYAGYGDVDGSKYTTPAISGIIRIQNAVALQAQIYAPSYVNSAQVFTITMVVTNTGDAYANTITPQLTVSSTGGSAWASVISSPPSSSIAGGSSAVFIWTYSAEGTGTIYFSGYAQGVDANSGLTVFSPGTSVRYISVQLPASLTITSFTVYPPTVAEQQMITVEMTVSNSGASTVSGVAPSLLQTGTGSITLLTGPAPSSQTLAGGQSVKFVWTYSAAGQGTVSFSGGAAGVDINTGLTVQTGPSVERVVNIIQQQAILTAEMIIAPQVAGFNQRITVYLSVTNTGLHNAVGVSPAAGLVAYTDNGVMKSLTVTADVASVNLPVGTSKVFKWVLETDSTVGTVVFSAVAIGQDAILPMNVTSNPAVSMPLSVEAPPVLVSRIDALPNTVNTGQAITIIMTVTNTGGSTAINVKPLQLIKMGTGNAVPANPTPMPESVTLPAGSTQTFTWTVLASTVGVIGWQGRAEGQDINTLATVNSSYSQTNWVLIQSPPVLQVSGINAPSSVSLRLSPYEGQLFTVTLTVTNSGDTTVNNLRPDPIELNQAPGALAGVISTPTPVDLAGHSSATFTWTFTALGTGTFSFSGKVTGIDSNSGAVVNSGIVTSGTIAVQQVATLASTLYVNPPMRYNGEVFTVLLVVTNTGGATAINVTPYHTSFAASSPSPDAYLISGPVPVSASIAGGSMKVFTWTYTASGVGSIGFSGYAYGQDGNYPAWDYTTTTTTASISINAAAALAASINALPAGPISIGQQITVIMDIQNTGLSNATNVGPQNLLMTTIGAPVTLISGPQPSTYTATLPPSASVSYTWTYSAAGSGTVAFSRKAVGFDPGRGVNIESLYALSNSIAIQTKAAFTSSIYAIPSQVNEGQFITVVMSVTNNGQTQADNITISASFVGTASVTQLGWFAPSSPLTLTSGANACFTWTLSADAAGTFALSATVSGTDAITSETVQVSNTSNNVVIYKPAALYSYIRTIPMGSLSESQKITVIMTVSNTGQAQANNVSYSISYEGTGGVIQMTSPVSPVTIAGGASRSFTWTFSANAQGIVTFSAVAVGATDAISGLPVPSTAWDEDVSITITEPLPSLQATLQVSSSTVPVPLNGYITVVMTIENSGIRTARAVTPTVNYNMASISLISGPVPAFEDSIPVGAANAKRFTWIYNAGATPGTLYFTANATGSNDGSSTQVTSNDAYGSIVIAPSNPRFNVSISAMPSIVPIGGAITVIMSVTNLGQLDAYNVYPLSMSNSALAGPSVAGTGYASVTTPAVAGITVTAGSSASFTWVYNAISGGDITFNDNLVFSYVDASGTARPNIINGTSVSSNTVSIQFGSSTTAHNDMYLSANSFNPAKGETVTIIISVSQVVNNAEILIYNIAGQKVRTISLGRLEAGILYTQLAIWDGRADDGRFVTSGIYYVKLKAGSFEQTKMVAVIKE
jgi:hypothetical protein